MTSLVSFPSQHQGMWHSHVLTAHLAKFQITNQPLAVLLFSPSELLFTLQPEGLKIIE
jgi:hypothetical protein